MKKRLTSLLALIIAVSLLCGGLTLSACAASNTITYNWQGLHAYDAGFAQGNIVVSVDGSSGGTYYLYWADDSAALSGFEPICKLTIANSGSGSFTMPENTAIPAKATRVIAFKSSSEPTDLSVSKAQINYTLPVDKAPYKTDADLLYSFASYSDMHITSGEDGAQGTKYPFDEEHLADAFRTAAARDVDFIVTTGDQVTNHRNDSSGGGHANPFYPGEWNTYLRILAQSDYDKPIYEAIGNHELWCSDSETDPKDKNWRKGYDYFCQMTGLDSTASSLNSGKAYYEITEPTTGDHFLFMALEGGFYTDRVDQFTQDQLDWLEAKLAAYQNDGKNVFIMEHANFEKWGAGDQLDNPIYDIPLKEKNDCPSTKKLKDILRTYKNAVLLCGHTHFQFDLNLNYSTNNKTSATIIHNSSVGAIRNIQNGTTRVNDTSREGTEGYIVEVYKDATIFQGTNLYTNKVKPSATYIVPQRTSALVEPTDPPAPTQAPTLPPQPTQAPVTQAPDPTEPPVQVLLGDADGDDDVTILDVTYIQRYEAGIRLATEINLVNADVDTDDEVTIIDATMIQRYLVGIIDRFPAEGLAATGEAYDGSEAGDKSDIAVVGAEVELEPAAADYSGLRSQAKTALDQYWLLASYDQYQALKKAYLRDEGYTPLRTAYTAFSTAVTGFYPGDTVDIYFTNVKKWDKVSAYCTAGHGKEKNASWPGKAMTMDHVNEYGQDVYKYTVPTGKYCFVIFNNGQSSGALQTVDLPLGAVRHQGYYIDNDLGTDNSKYICSYFYQEE